MTDSPYPPRGGKGRPADLPYHEGPPIRSQFPDKRPSIDQEVVGAEIQRLARKRGITASAAADLVLSPEVSLTVEGEVGKPWKHSE